MMKKEQSHTKANWGCNFVSIKVLLTIKHSKITDFFNTMSVKVKGPAAVVSSPDLLGKLQNLLLLLAPVTLYQTPTALDIYRYI